MREYKKLDVWKMAVELSTETYKAAMGFPKSELYGITSQIQRSAVSVASNIAEGAGRGSDKQFSQFLHIAYGSLCELETQLIIAKNLEYLNEDQLGFLSDKVIHLQKKIYNLDKTLNNQS